MKLLALITLILGLNAHSHHHHRHLMADEDSEEIHRCGTDEYMEDQLANDPVWQASLDQFEVDLKAKVAAGDFKNAIWEGNLEIPVVMHVLYTSGQPQRNLDYERIMSNMDVINLDFLELNEDVADTPAEFAPFVANFSMVYKLSEIKRVQTNTNQFSTNNDMKYSSRGGSDIVDRNHYLNVWICVLSGGILGYAQFPGGNAATDGIVIATDTYGSIDYDYDDRYSGMFSTYNLGRTTTHEIGHWINLRHIWGDGGCSATDFVDDTPIAGGSYGGCPSYPQTSCGSSDMFMNYMDYVYDQCMIMLTQGQFERSETSINTQRNTLLDYVGQGTSSFVSSFQFAVSTASNPITCAPNDVTGSVNINNGHPAAPTITSCVSHTTNNYVQPIVDVTVTSSGCPSNDATWYFTYTNLNYGVFGASFVGVCFQKSTNLNTAYDNRLTDVQFFAYSNAQDDPYVEDGYELILTNVNGGVGGDFVYLGVKYGDGPNRSNKVKGDKQKLGKMNENKNGNNGSSTLSMGPIIGIVIGLASLLILIVAVTFYVIKRSKMKDEVKAAMEVPMVDYGTTAEEKQ